MKKLDTFVIAFIFYLGWFGSVFLGTTEYRNASLLFPLVLIGFLILREHLNFKEIALSISIFVIGTFFDFLLLHFAFVTAIGTHHFSIPVWLVSIWLLFSFSIVKLANSLRAPLWLAVILGFFMGPLSYKSGEIFKVLTFTSPFTLLIYAVFWALMFPAVLILSKRCT